MEYRVTKSEGTELIKAVVMRIIFRKLFKISSYETAFKVQIFNLDRFYAPMKILGNLTFQLEFSFMSIVKIR